MRIWQHFIGVFLVLGLAFGIVGWQSVEAAEQEYVSKARAKTLHQAPLEGVEGKEVIIKHFSIPPKFVGGKHMHPASVFVYVLEGEFTVETEDGPKTFRAGELYPEPLRKSMVAKNLSATDDLELIVFQIGDVGKPMMVKVE